MLVFAAALAVAVFLTFRWERTEPVAFETAVARAELAERIRRDDTRCPLSSRALVQSPDWVLAACASGGLGWHEAAGRYGEDAARVFHVYGDDPVFAAVFERLGHAVVPVVAYYVRNGSTHYLLRESFGQSIARLWNNGEVGFMLAELTPEQYGLLAVHEIEARGHEMLSEFEIAGGVAVRKPVASTLLGAKNLVLGGVSDLEAVIARGERLPSWGEMGWAMLDAAIVVGGIGAATKALRVAKAPAVAAARGTATLATVRAAGQGAVRSLATVGKAAGVAGIVALPYVAVTRPDLVAGAGGWLAEQTGLPSWSGVFAIYTLICLAVAFLLRLVLGPLVWVLSILARLVRLAIPAGRARPA